MHWQIQLEAPRANFFNFHATFGKKSCQIIGLSPKSRGWLHYHQSGNYWISHLFGYSDKTGPTQTNIGVTDILPSVISKYLGLIIIKPSCFRITFYRNLSVINRYHNRSRIFFLLSKKCWLGFKS